MKKRLHILLTALAAFFAWTVAAVDVNVGPLFEYDSEKDFVAVRPFWSSTPKTEDFVWPLGTWHTADDAFWYRFLFLVYGHERSVNVFPLWFSGRDRETDEFHWAAFPLYGEHPHMLFMDDIHFVLWPLYMDYSVKDVKSHAVLWPIFSWKDSPREAVGIWPAWGWSRLRESIHYYMLWPIFTCADYGKDRDTSGAGRSYMIWPLYGEVQRECERQRLILPPFFSVAETPQTWRLRCPWPFVDVELGVRRDRWSVWPIVEHSVQKRYADGQADDSIWRFGWQLAEKTNSRLNVFPFFTMEKNFVRVWPFWSRRTDGGCEKVKVPDIVPIRDADGLVRNWEPFWTLYSSEDLPDGSVRRRFLFNIFWWTSKPDTPK